jgi:hypothetical protein
MPSMGLWVALPQPRFRGYVLPYRLGRASSTNDRACQVKKKHKLVLNATEGTSEPGTFSPLAGVDAAGQDILVRTRVDFVQNFTFIRQKYPNGTMHNGNSINQSLYLFEANPDSVWPRLMKG